MNGRSRVTGVARLCLAAAALSGVACGTAVNYLDASGPLYETRHAPVRTTAGPGFRVATFNIEYAIHVDRAIKVLQDSPELKDLDLLALQEMDAPGVESIAEALGLNSLYIPSGVEPKTGRELGSALLSPWPLIEPRKVPLPHGARGTGLRRAAAGATLLRAGSRMRVYSVQFPSPLAVSGGSRRDEADTLLADAADSTDPVLIAGDFNSHGIGKRFVEGGYAWLTKDVGHTLSEVGVLRLSYDHIFIKGLRVAAVVPSAGVVRDNQKASDHHPVWAVLD